jgi:RNA polymerase sigma-70 factor (ECF subfamily)
MTDERRGQEWLASFHEGIRHVLEQFYRDHYATVDRAVARVLQGADRETVVHEVFFRILSSRELRSQLRGGSAAAWITTVARNHAIDFQRRHRREILDEDPRTRASDDHGAMDATAEARLLLERFRRDVLPTKWRSVFDACFVSQMTQRDAATKLGVPRTTLLYRQHRIRALLRRFLLEDA